jgi:hypothetical protein
MLLKMYISHLSFQLTDISFSLSFFWVVMPSGLAGKIPVFQSNILPPLSALKMEAVCFSIMLIFTY